MELKQAESIVMSKILKAVDQTQEISLDMHLIGGSSLLDSMKLVEVCLALEDEAEDLGFEFDWTSDTAMSKSRSMFKNIGTLAKEFAFQSER